MTKFSPPCFVQAASVVLFLCIAGFAQGQGSGVATPPSGPLVLPATSSSSANPIIPVAPETPIDFREHEARIGPGDLVEVKVFGWPEMSQEVRVNNAGILVLPLAGPIVAQGLSIAELAQKIAATLRDGGFMNDPQVNVSAKELHSAAVMVSGEVAKPGVYPIYGSCSIPDLIVAAGGLTPKSGHIVTITHRDRPDTPINVDISSTAVNSNPNFSVFPGDKLVVTKAGVVYVLGDVGHAAGLVLEGNEKMTVLQAIALAGGTGKDAGLNGSRVIRRSPQGVEQFSIPLKDILKARKQDVELLAGDVLYIPTSKGKEAWRGATAILQMATVLTILGPL
jgi:polysaccharide export outer membrane protein